ncbi:hypothetical protein [uncultured Imperialibacter sp.]|uniref:hypothetical protein n=1 Tax=uncultured Imperialibacter sp. TaxID=1672639 RepID=UPI0030DDB6E2|tara:strand:+ start:2889 stop:3527 length:639 start_codon:yes stop_codon:yes gene_type:complete
MKNRMFFFAALLATAHGAWSQNAERLNEKLEDWYFGTIVMASGDVIECDFAYNPLTIEGLLQFSYEGVNYTAGPSKVSSFSFYDEERNLYRKFQSFPVYSEMTEMTNEIFMEILHETQFISLVGRKTTGLKPGYGFNANAVITQKNVIKGYERYFIDMTTARIHEMTKKEFFKLTSDKKPEIKSFMKEEHVQLNDSAGFIKLMEFYASLKLY